ncbi:MAG: dTDP-4-dehydrorhamnose reductase [Solirubrobacteraceae bacterium]|nr:dTDP-4-dehydrorhamnose reductase [Solirubrobacteraceae bacterium]
MARLFVTGLGGFLGSDLGRRALAAGWTVSGIAGARELDVRDAAAVRTAVARAAPDVVIHTAYRMDDRSVTVQGTRAVVAAAAAAGARLVHLSTDVVFSGAQGRALTEDDVPDPVTPYGRDKRDAERLCPDGALVVRTSLLYGGAAPSRQEREILEAADGRRDMAFFSDEVRCPIAVGDLATALLELAAGEPTGVLHVAGPDALTRHELARLVAAHHGRDPDALRAAPGPPDRPKRIVLDCSRASRVLRTRVRGVREVLA